MHNLIDAGNDAFVAVPVDVLAKLSVLTNGDVAVEMDPGSAVRDLWENAKLHDLVIIMYGERSIEQQIWSSPVIVVHQNSWQIRLILGMFQVSAPA